MLPIFNVVATPQITRYNGQSEAAVTLATISTTEASFSILGDMPGGLAPSITAGPVVDGLNTFTVAWPASAPYVKPFGLYRATLNYVRSTGDGGVFGSSLHEVLVLDPAILLTYATRVDLVGRIAQPVSASLATLSFGANVDVTAAIVGAVPGLSFNLAWTPGATSTGTLSAAGTPTAAGAYSVAVTYQALGVVLGSSTHAVLIGAAAEPPAPAPEPAPPPDPLPPAPPPPPAVPVPPPAPQGDALLASNKVRHHFHAAALVRATQAEPNTFYSFFASPGQTSFTLPVALIGDDSITVSDVVGQGMFDEGSVNYPATASGAVVTISGALRHEPVYCYYRVNRVRVSGWADQLGNSFTGTGVRAEGSGAAGGAAYVYSGGSLSAGVSDCDGVLSSIVAELMANISDEAWAAHTASAGAVNRYSPVLTLLTASGEVAWSFGFFSTSGMMWSQGDPRRVTMTANFVGNTASAKPIFMIGTYLASKPAGYTHMASIIRLNGSLAQQGMWTGGASGANFGRTDAASRTRPASPGALRIAGVCPVGSVAVYGSSSIAHVPFSGSIDELRLTVTDRYLDYYAATIPEAARQVPWPDY